MSRGVVRHDEASNVAKGRGGQPGADTACRHEAGAARRRDGTSGRRCGLPGRGLACRVGYEQVRRKVPACECLDCQPGCVLEWVIEDSRQVQARLRMSSGVGGSGAIRHVGETWHGVRCRQVGRGEPGWVSQEGRAQAWVVASGSFTRGRLVAGVRGSCGSSGWAGDDSSGPAVLAGRACRSARRGDGTGSRGSRDGMAGEGLSGGLSNARARPVGTGAAGAELGFVGGETGRGRSVVASQSGAGRVAWAWLVGTGGDGVGVGCRRDAGRLARASVSTSGAGQGCFGVARRVVRAGTVRIVGTASGGQGCGGLSSCDGAECHETARYGIGLPARGGKGV